MSTKPSLLRLGSEASMAWARTAFTEAGLRRPPRTHSLAADCPRRIASSSYQKLLVLAPRPQKRFLAWPQLETLPLTWPRDSDPRSSRSRQERLRRVGRHRRQRPNVAGSGGTGIGSDGHLGDPLLVRYYVVGTRSPLGVSRIKV